MEKRTAKVRVDEAGVVAIEVDISPGPERDDLVTTQQVDESVDGDVLGRIKGARAPRWVELAGG